uniref:Uncharacterized protein n=1 Tax=Timema poppense TaxID=170557 RepID=A0A7R9DDI3_TIMPO|nr:unnamed protein product [Timema poppensis]
MRPSWIREGQRGVVGQMIWWRWRIEAGCVERSCGGTLGGEEEGYWNGAGLEWFLSAERVGKKELAARMVLSAERVGKEELAARMVLSAERVGKKELAARMRTGSLGFSVRIVTRLADRAGLEGKGDMGGYLKLLSQLTKVGHVSREQFYTASTAARVDTLVILLLYAEKQTVPVEDRTSVNNP